MQKTTLAREAYLRLKEQLFEMNSGDFLSIRQYSIKYGMSYTPVREAFLLLQKEGLLRKIPNVGFFVQKPDYMDFKNVYQVRKCIETFCLSEVFEQITDKDIAELEKLGNQIRQMQNLGKYTDCLDLDISWHLLLVQKCQNHYLENLYLKARNRYEDFIVKNLKAMDIEAGSAQSCDHGQIIFAIKQGCLTEALQLLDDHISNGYEQMMDIFQHRTGSMQNGVVNQGHKPCDYKAN